MPRIASMRLQAKMEWPSLPSSDTGSSPPDDITVTSEFTDHVASGMEKLGKKHREILILRNVQNHSYEEIAEILGISVGTVKSRIARAREALRELLGEDFK